MGNPLIGVNYNSEVLHRKEAQPPKEPDHRQTEKNIAFCKENHWNLIRIPCYMEAAFGQEAKFFEELDDILANCKIYNIQAIPDVHHFNCTSLWGPGGTGLSSQLVGAYHPGAPLEYESSLVVRQFWKDLYENHVEGIKNGWGKLSDFIEQLIEASRPYNSIIYGYEILNEPHFWEVMDYSDFGKMITWIAQQLRKVTKKPLIFTRETGHGGFKRQPSAEYLIRPKVKNTIYSPHLYRPDALGQQWLQWKDVIDQWDIKGADVRLFVGEFADQTVPNAPTQANTEAFVKFWHEHNIDATYWAAFLNSQDPANRITAPGPLLTVVGKWYVDAIKKYYI